MANVNAPKGLIPRRMISGAPYSATTMIVEHPATDATKLGIGDAVKMTGAANTATGIPNVTLAAAGDAIAGVVVNVLPKAGILASESTRYVEASTLRQLEIEIGLNQVVFEIQSNGTVVSGDMGALANLSVGTVNTSTGLTTSSLDESSIVTTAGPQLKILSLMQDSTNALGLYGKLEVLIHLSEFANNVAGV